MVHFQGPTVFFFLPAFPLEKSRAWVDVGRCWAFPLETSPSRPQLFGRCLGFSGTPNDLLPGAPSGRPLFFVAGVIWRYMYVIVII